MEYASNEQWKTERSQHVTGWTWKERRGSWPTIPKNPPGHCSGESYAEETGLGRRDGARAVDLQTTCDHGDRHLRSSIQSGGPPSGCSLQIGACRLIPSPSWQFVSSLLCTYLLAAQGWWIMKFIYLSFRTVAWFHQAICKLTHLVSTFLRLRVDPRVSMPASALEDSSCS